MSRQKGLYIANIILVTSKSYSHWPKNKGKLEKGEFTLLERSKKGFRNKVTSWFSQVNPRINEAQYIEIL